MPAIWQAGLAAGSCAGTGFSKPGTLPAEDDIAGSLNETPASRR